MKRSISLGLLALVAAAGDAFPPAMAQAAEVEMGTATIGRPNRQSDGIADQVAVVRGGRAGEPAPPIVLSRADWDAFLAETRVARARVAQAAADDAEARLKTAVDEAVAAMRTEIPTFIGWRFSFFTTYRLTFTAISGAATGSDPEAAVRLAVAERFRELVLKPGMVRSRLAQAMDEVTLTAAGRREAFVAERRIALDHLARHRGQPSAAASPAMVPEADALDLPALSSLRPALPVAESTDEVGWLGQREVLVMAGRQVARRGIAAVAEPAALAAAPVSLMETAPFVVGAAAGATVLGAGLAIEFVALKLWESTEREALEEEAHGALNRYHRELTGVIQPIAGALVTGTLGPAR